MTKLGSLCVGLEFDSLRRHHYYALAALPFKGADRSPDLPHRPARIDNEHKTKHFNAVGCLTSALLDEVDIASNKYSYSWQW